MGETSCAKNGRYQNMDKVKQLQTSLEASIKDSALGRSEYYKMAESKSGVPGVYLVLGAFAVFLLWLIFLPGAHFITNFLSFSVPAWYSYKSIETKSKED